MSVLSQAVALATATATAVLGSDMPMPIPGGQNDVSVAMPMHDDMSADSSSPPATRRPIDPAFGGCGRTDLNASYQYGLINERMHSGMSLNFTTSSEYNFLAGMIPHHTAAVEMCNVYLHELDTREDISANTGIESLCYNITYGPASWGKWQYDFSQPGETEQMLNVLKDIDMMTEYERGCADLSDGQMAYGEGHHGGDMFMGCGRLDLPQVKDYMAANMKMHGLMSLNFTDDAAVTFLLGMIPHHEGAIEMCDTYYMYWKCAPSRRPCWDAHPLDGIPADRLSYGKTRDVLGQMKHICTDHIMGTQPKEVAWMKAELRRLSPDSLSKYEDMQQTGVFPCDSVSVDGAMMDHHSMHDDMSGGNMLAETNSGIDQTAGQMKDMLGGVDGDTEPMKMGRDGETRVRRRLGRLL
mmetsp:Transcript_6642/g.18562  ORF Transcript_6642/g.18562 Transcript_6642/m.18562 type:complete len:411 (-) Transcript_6642:14-1246(-)